MTVETHNRRGITVHTGGVKEFFYVREDLERISSEDTESSIAFKKALKEIYHKYKPINLRKLEPKKRGPDSKNGSCDYHLFEEGQGIIYRCLYCSKYFCKLHLDPKCAGMPKFNSTKKEDLLFMEEWRKPGRHPCPDYYDYFIESVKQREQEYGRVLDTLLKGPIQREIKPQPEDSWKLPEEQSAPIAPSSSVSLPNARFKNWAIFFAIWALVATLILIYVFGKLFL